MLLGRKAMTIVHSALKSRDFTLLDKFHLVKLQIFQYSSIDVFELLCWRRLLRVSLTARRSSQSILKEISPEYSLEGLIMKLKLQYFGHLMQRTDSLEKTLMLGKIEEGRRRERRKMRWHHHLNRHEFE